MKYILSKDIKRFLILFFIFIFVTLFSYNFVYADSEEPTLQSKAAILVDNSTNKVLYSKNADEKMFPASTTKIMTAILENCR